MVELSIRNYLLDLYNRSLLLCVDSIYGNYRYTVENDKLVLLDFVDINIVKEQLKNNRSLFIDPYFDICRLSINLGVMDDCLFYKIELGNSFERIDSFLVEDMLYQHGKNSITSELHAHSVTKICDYAFGETYFPTIFRGNNVKKIGASAFRYNNVIKEVYVPKCEIFQDNCFSSADSLSYVESNAMKVGYHSFYDTYLDSIKMNKNVCIHPYSLNNSGSSGELLRSIATYSGEKENKVSLIDFIIEYSNL